MSTRHLDRRSFLKTAGAAGLALAGGCVSAGPRRPGANDTIRIGVVGLHGQGGNLMRHVLKHEGVRITALCDVDSAVLAERADELGKAGVKVERYADVRQLLERAPVDAVVIATPNHHHALQAVWACQAGKDVYVEKPVAHTMFESRQLRRLAERYPSIVQAGTQNRSDVGLIEAFDYVRKGELGRIRCVRGFCYRVRDSIGKVDGPQPVPASVDYDLWCGPAPKTPLLRKSLHYDWHWIWANGNGDIGNQGPHELDLIRWVLDEPGLPSRVLSIGGRLGYVDDGQTPNTQFVLFDYKTAPVFFEVRGLPVEKNVNAEDHYLGVRVGVVVECENGYFAGGRGGGAAYDNKRKKIRAFKGDAGGQHMQNFFDAMRSRRTADLHAPVACGAISADLAHMANLSHRVGAAAQPGEIRERIAANTAAAGAYDRILTHLAANKVDPAKTPLTLGAWLEWNAPDHKFSGGANFEQANALMTRDYRAPFVMPEV